MPSTRITSKMYTIPVHFTIMRSISYTELRENLSSILNIVERDHIAYHIKRRGHKNIILLPEEDYESIQETLYLLSNPVNADRIKEAIKQAEKEEFTDVDLDD